MGPCLEIAERARSCARTKQHRRDWLDVDVCFGDGCIARVGRVAARAASESPRVTKRA